MIKEIAHRFREYYPVVIDIETAGFNSETDAILEIGVGFIEAKSNRLQLKKVESYNIKPFEGANIEQSSINFNKIKPFDPKRNEIEEKTALKEIFRSIRKEVKENNCKKAIMVAHNSIFDQSFLNAAAKRNNLDQANPFHLFSTFDTVSLAGLALGQTVLAKSCKEAGISFCTEQAHSAKYDTEKTAELFCWIVNRWEYLENNED